MSVPLCQSDCNPAPDQKKLWLWVVVPDPAITSAYTIFIILIQPIDHAFSASVLLTNTIVTLVLVVWHNTQTLGTRDIKKPCGGAQKFKKDLYLPLSFVWPKTCYKMDIKRIQGSSIGHKGSPKTSYLCPKKFTLGLFYISAIIC